MERPENSQGQATLRVAWIGNSFTYFNDLPEMCGSLLAEVGIKMDSERITPGWQTLVRHAADTDLRAMLSDRGPWDFVVIQENSAIPGGADPAAYETSRQVMRSFFKHAAGDAKLLVYETWGHLHGSFYAKLRKSYPDYETMQQLTSAGCRGYLKELGPRAQLVPVGSAFHDVFVRGGRTVSRGLFPRLYAPDHFHPSRLGTYLAACVFYSAFTGGKSPTGLEYLPRGGPFDAHQRRRSGWIEDQFPLDVSLEDARVMQMLAWERVQNVMLLGRSHL